MKTGVLPAVNGRLTGVSEETYSITWYTTWNYSLRNYYTDDVDYIPKAGVNAHNGYVQVQSSVPNSCVVDYGDGVKEQHLFAKVSDSLYVLIFRSLNCDIYDGVKDYFIANLPKYRGVPPHHYADDKTDVQRSVYVKFENPVTYVMIDLVSMTAFPSVHSSALTTLIVRYTKYITDIPFDIFQYIPNLINLTINNLFSDNDLRIQKIPESLFTMTDLSILSCTKIFDLSDIEASGIRNISKLQKLNNLNINDCLLPAYIKEFNDMPALTNLQIYHSFSGYEDFTSDPTTPSFDEVEEINQHLKTLYVTSYRKTLEVPISGKGIENLTNFFIGYYNTLDDIETLPSYFLELRSVTDWDFNNSFTTVDKADRFVKAFYALVTGWDQLTMSETALDGKRNQFYGIKMKFYMNALFASTANARPSGTYQSPEGFEQGVSNGNPSTPMEMIYVLENNYAETWIIRPEEETDD